MNNDLSILHLISEASVVVQLVMLILLCASVVSWTFIFAKRKELKQAVRVTDEFEAQINMLIHKFFKRKEHLFPLLNVT